MLTSFDCAKLIVWLSYLRHGICLERVATQKLLYIAYGLYLAKYGRVIFSNEQAIATPLGTFFKEAYKRHNSFSVSDIGDNEKRIWMQGGNIDFLCLAIKVVDEYHSKSSFDLLAWDDRPETPFNRLIEMDREKFRFGTSIPKELLEEYFRTDSWKIGL